MKKLAIALAVLVLANAQSAFAGVVDLTKPVPKTLELTAGETVVFENKAAKITAKETDGKGKLFSARPHNALNQYGAFLATRAGEGEIVVQFPSKGLLTVIDEHVIKVKVNPAPAVHTLNYSKKPFPSFPANLDVAAKDYITVEVQFKGDPGLFDPLYTPRVVTTDGQKDDVLESISGVRRKDANTIEAWRFKALRKGTAEIQFVSPDGKVKGSVKVTVK